MNHALIRHQHYDLYRKYHAQDSEIRDLLGEYGIIGKSRDYNDVVPVCQRSVAMYCSNGRQQAVCIIVGQDPAKCGIIWVERGIDKHVAIAKRATCGAHIKVCTVRNRHGDSFVRNVCSRSRKAATYANRPVEMVRVRCRSTVYVTTCAVAKVGHAASRAIKERLRIGSPRVYVHVSSIPGQTQTINGCLGFSKGLIPLACCPIRKARSVCGSFCF